MNARFEVTVPRALLDYGIGQAEFQRRSVEWLVLSLYTQERISSGKAAALLGVHRLDFLDLLRSYGIAYIDLSPEEHEALAAHHLVELDQGLGCRRARSDLDRDPPRSPGGL